MHALLNRSSFEIVLRLRFLSKNDCAEVGAYLAPAAVEGRFAQREKF